MKPDSHSEEILTQVQSAVAPLTEVIQEIRVDLKKHVEKEAERISSIDDRLDKHLEIYANNGKESKRVADNLAMMIEREKVRDERADLRDAKTDEMWKKFETDKIVAVADKKRLQTIILYGGATAAIVGTLTFLVKLGS